MTGEWSLDEYIGFCISLMHSSEHQLRWMLNEKLTNIREY